MRNIIARDVACVNISRVSVRDTYHHGDLRRALLNTALELIARVGPEGLTLREVARRAGVSHNAPYRHFASRDELVAAVAIEGHTRLAADLGAASASGDSLEARLTACGQAYVAFALQFPNHFAAMFHVRLSEDAHPGYEIAAEETFRVLLGLMTEVVASGHARLTDPRELAVDAWSLVHGIAELAIAHQLAPRTADEILALSRGAISIFLKGLLVP